jgi:hypothetical protein
MSFMPDKKCFRCGEIKPLSDFYVHKHMFDGHLNKCKACTRKDTAFRVMEKQSDPAWVLKEAERQRVKQYKKKDEWASRYADSASTRSKKYTEKYPEKKKATTAVSNALRDGRMDRKPCEVCGAHRAQAHHDDYSKPLDVVWLCSTHHAERHVWLNDQKRIAKALALKAQRESQQQ